VKMNVKTMCRSRVGPPAHEVDHRTTVSGKEKMARNGFTPKDIDQIEAHGLAPEQVTAQLAHFRHPPPLFRPDRPCTIGDGIRSIPEPEQHRLIERYDHHPPARGCLKFVPASGAASRMFRDLLGFFNSGEEIDLAGAESMAKAGRKDARALLDFMGSIDKFAFFDDLASHLSAGGKDLGKALEGGRFHEVLHCLLDPHEMDCAALPKGLIKFHAYPDGNRTPFEEHLVEAASYASSGQGRCRLNCTVSNAHRRKFEDLLARERGRYERMLGVSFDVEFSVQPPATDTIAVDPDNRPFRTPDGRLLFRPGGHGALLAVLNSRDEDMIFIKNIDNVAPDRLKPETVKWKKVLAGYMLRLQDRIFSFMKGLHSENVNETLPTEAVTFLWKELAMPVPSSFETLPNDEKRAFLLDALDRPLRVCGMVESMGEPGGGPFWLKGARGDRAPQIVEKGQIDPHADDGETILKSATHFNPVDLVCGIRDWRGGRFDLNRFTDPDAVLISVKSKGGRDIKALEHPGLWNGGMARWNTALVEVPAITFNPVKVVNDLLRKEHQPAQGAASIVK